MAVELHTITSLVYLLAAILAGAGLALPSRRLGRASVIVLVLGALSHALAFAAFHQTPTPPPLTDQPAAVSLTAWLGVLSFLALMRRARLQTLVAAVAFAASLGTFFAAMRFPHSAQAPLVGGAWWPHLHVLLASAGLALLGLAGLAGLAFLAEDRRLKAKRAQPARVALPSLEGLDRVNGVALAVGFPLLTTGLVTGALWVFGESGRYWTGSPHELASMSAWLVYAALLAARVRAHGGARQAALASVAGFAVLLLAVLGVGFFA
jgi:ABC-type transport system involved in cytochrome c biogenesis permease subunit